MLTQKQKTEIYVSVMEGLFRALHPELKTSGVLNESEKERPFDKKKAVRVLSTAAGKLSDKLLRHPSLLEDKIEKDEYGTNVFTLCGGLNGGGPYMKWTGYFQELSKFVADVSKKYHIWLIELKNDCLDDIFYAKFGIRDITADDRERDYDSPTLLNYWEANAGK